MRPFRGLITRRRSREVSVITSLIPHNERDGYVFLSHPLPYCSSFLNLLPLFLSFPPTSLITHLSLLVSYIFSTPLSPSILIYPSFHSSPSFLASLFLYLFFLHSIISLCHSFTPSFLFSLSSISHPPTLSNPSVFPSLSLSLPLFSSLSLPPCTCVRGEIFPSTPPRREGSIFFSPACYYQVSDASGVISENAR